MVLQIREEIGFVLEVCRGHGIPLSDSGRRVRRHDEKHAQLSRGEIEDLDIDRLGRQVVCATRFKGTELVSAGAFVQK